MAAFESFTLFLMTEKDYQNAEGKAIDLPAMADHKHADREGAGHEKMEYWSIGVKEYLRKSKK